MEFFKVADIVAFVLLFFLFILIVMENLVGVIQILRDELDGSGSGCLIFIICPVGHKVVNHLIIGSLNNDRSLRDELL